MADKNLTHVVTAFAGRDMTIHGTAIKAGVELTERQAELLEKRAAELKREDVKVERKGRPTPPSRSES